MILSVRPLTTAIVFTGAVVGAYAENHTVSFFNECVSLLYIVNDLVVIALISSMQMWTWNR